MLFSKFLFYFSGFEVCVSVLVGSLPNLFDEDVSDATPNKMKDKTATVPKIKPIFVFVISPFVNREKEFGLIKPIIKQTNEVRNTSEYRLLIFSL